MSSRRTENMEPWATRRTSGRGASPKCFCQNSWNRATSWPRPSCCMSGSSTDVAYVLGINGDQPALPSALHTLKRASCCSRVPSI